MFAECSEDSFWLAHGEGRTLSREDVFGTYLGRGDTSSRSDERGIRDDVLRGRL